MTEPRKRAPEALSSTRPWGNFTLLSCGEPVAVKVMTVLPGQRLSRQRHDRRAEYWLMLDEGLDAWVNHRQVPSEPGSTVWIPCGAAHRLGNVGPTPARVLEIAFGDFDEGDIERLDDDYGR